ncbi:MAG: family 78 glycoside hydrolase catalytic domain [Bacteroidales bacterium]|nr:family 78 glycoside hydrolase catalytic domain [Bacteroidales bacterium]
MKRTFLALSLLLASAIGQAAIQPTRLTVEGRADQPLGLDITTPRLGWQLSTDAGEVNVKQTQYHIQVASSPERLTEGKPDLWDVTVKSATSQYITYAGKPLKHNQRCYWRVQIESSYQTNRKSNKVKTTLSDWSEISEWGVGLLSETHWKGYWIGLDRANEWDVETEHSRLSARYYKSSFATTKQVQRATLHIAGLGLYEAYLNGQKVGNDVLTPAPTYYTKSIIYNTYDVTDLVQSEATNDIRVTVSNGRFYTMQQNKKKYKIRNFGYPTLRANLIIEYSDGSTQTIATENKTWQMTCDGPIRSANEYDGEIYDARKADLSADSLWFMAERSNLPNGELLGNVTPAMGIVDSLGVRELTKQADGSVILDFGQNFAGWVRSSLDGMSLREGDTLRLRYAERLDSVGQLYVENLRHSQSTDYYIAAGKDKGTWAPRFTTHGGRYVEVSVLRNQSSGKTKSLAQLSDDQLRSAFTAQVVSDRMDVLYDFETQNETLNQLVKNSFWGILDNYKGMPIDCPQRDERMPWLGDRAMGCLGESYLLDNHHLYNKWMRDIEESQRQDGCIPDVAPTYWNYYSDNVTWPSVFVFGAQMLYNQFGDDKAIIEHYPAMRKWLLHLYNDKRTKEGLVKADKYADWCVTPESPELIHSKDPSRVTDGVLIGSCYMYKLLEVMTDFDEILLSRIQHSDLKTQRELARRGISPDLLQADRDEYNDMRRQLREAINREFLHVKRGTSPAPSHPLYPDSIYYANNAVTANLLPLAFGIVPEEHADMVHRQILAKIMLNPADGHLCCGVIGIQWLMRELSKRGRMDIAYLLATNRTFPSWGYMIENGATTIWELWNGDTANPRMNSGNHVMLLGDLLPWCFEHVGGIRPAAPGFKQICLAPNFELEELSWANVSYKTPYGQVVSTWKKTPGHLSWDIVIPANTSAIVITPNGSEEYGSGSWHIEQDLPHKERNYGSTWQVRDNEFLYEEADFPSCHSASIVECANGDLLATYFGGSREGSPDVCIWTQRKSLIKRGKKGQPHLYQDGWSAPQLVADGKLQPVAGQGWRQWAASDQNASISKFVPREPGQPDTLRKAAYNPVLFQVPGGDLLLFYKLGKDVRDWTGYLMTSSDNGHTWTTHRDSIQPAQAALFSQIAGTCVERDSLLGAIKNQPIALPAGFRCRNGQVLSRQRILAPTSKETETASKVKAGHWRCYVEISEDDGRTWTLSPVVPQRDEIRPIQPALLVHPDGRIQMVCRSAQPKEEGREDLARITSSFSDDGGLTWSEMQLLDVPNNNSGIDAVTMADGTFALIYNPFSCVDWRPKTDPARNKPLRNPLYLATSTDGIHWTPALTLESSPISQYSYPSMIVGSDGTLHCIYTWRRQRIKYQRVVPTRP